MLRGQCSSVSSLYLQLCRTIFFDQNHVHLHIPKQITHYSGEHGHLEQCRTHICHIYKCKHMNTKFRKKTSNREASIAIIENAIIIKLVLRISEKTSTQEHRV